MASPLPEIPLEFMNPRMKYALMNWLVRGGYPARISLQVLGHWGEAMGVEITSTDYELMIQHRLTSENRKLSGQGLLPWE